MTYWWTFIVIPECHKILTHWGRVMHICVGKLSIIVNWTLRNKLPWNFNRNSNIFIQENAFESVVCEMAAILSRPQCVKVSWYFVTSPTFHCHITQKCYVILEKIYLKFVAGTVLVDGLAPSGARTSAGTVMTRFQVLYSYGTGTGWVKWPMNLIC